MSKHATSTPSLTQARLKELLHYDPLTGLFTRRISVSSRARAGSIAGGVNCKGYWEIRIDNRTYKAHRLAFLYVTGELPDGDVDHVNRERADNRWENLRPATGSQNCGNVSLRRDNTSGIKGVCWDKHHKKWVAQIGVNGRSTKIGSFRDINDAAAAYAAAAQRYFGEFAHVAKA